MRHAISSPLNGDLRHARTTFESPTAESSAAMDATFSFEDLSLKSLLSTLQLQRGDVDAPRVIEVRAAPLLSVDNDSAGMVWMTIRVLEGTR